MHFHVPAWYLGWMWLTVLRAGWLAVLRTPRMLRACRATFFNLDNMRPKCEESHWNIWWRCKNPSDYGDVRPMCDQSHWNTCQRSELNMKNVARHARHTSPRMCMFIIDGLRGAGKSTLATTPPCISMGQFTLRTYVARHAPCIQGTFRPIVNVVLRYFLHEFFRRWSRQCC